MVTLFLLHTDCSSQLIMVIKIAELVFSLPGYQSGIKGIDPRVKQSYC